MIIRNYRELEEAYQTDVFDRFFIIPEAKDVVKESLERTLEMLVDAYGEDGDGGYIRVIPSSISTEDGQNEYLAELAKYNLEPEDFDFDDILVQSHTEEVHMQLYVMTEFNLVLLYVQNI